MLPRPLPVILFAGLALSLPAPESGRAAEPPASTDLHGDPLPAGAVARLGTVRWRAQHWVSSMAFVPGGKHLATTNGYALSVWDLDTGRVVRTISTDGTSLGDGFQCFTFTPDGKRLLSADQLGSKLPKAMGGRQ